MKRSNYKEIVELEVEIIALTGKIESLRRRLVELKSNYSGPRNQSNELIDLKAREVFLQHQEID